MIVPRSERMANPLMNKTCAYLLSFVQELRSGKLATVLVVEEEVIVREIMIACVRGVDCRKNLLKKPRVSSNSSAV
jgi:hypothetical protein